MTINEVQDEIISEFSLLEGDMEMTIFYIMELGQKLPEMDNADKIEENVVKGCQSKVWLTASTKNDKVFFVADSNTAITKGLVSLLIRIFNGQTPDAILDADLYFMRKNRHGTIHWNPAIQWLRGHDQADEVICAGFQNENWRQIIMEPLENIDNQKLSETTVPDLQEKVLAAVKTVYDPEIPVDIYELGLIYEINIYPVNNVYVQMTLTSPSCPSAEVIPGEVEHKIKAIEGVNDVKVEVTFDPPYSQDMMSEAAKLELGFL